MKRGTYPTQSEDPEFWEVMGRLAVEGLMFGEQPAMPSREPVSIDAALEAAKVEPHLTAALPALVWKRPRVFKSVRRLPGELAAAVEALKKGGSAHFGGRGPAALSGWVKKLDGASKRASRLKAFRFTNADQELLLGLADELGLSETDVVRHALRVLEAQSKRA
jgi:hypothetical protein